ncbi:MAG: IPT/TIG domain-containing protein [Patescibacteria group bacterium]
MLRKLAIVFVLMILFVVPSLASGAISSSWPIITMVRGSTTSDFEVYAGADMSITGSNLSGYYLTTTYVSVGGIRAAVNQADDTFLVVSTPELPDGVYEVYVINEKGASAPVKVRLHGKQAKSDNDSDPSIEVINLMGGERFAPGDVIPVAYSFKNLIGRKIQIYLVGDSSYEGDDVPINVVFIDGKSSGDSNFNMAIPPDVRPGIYSLNICSIGTPYPAFPKKNFCIFSHDFIISSQSQFLIVSHPNGSQDYDVNLSVDNGSFVQWDTNVPGTAYIYFKFLSGSVCYVGQAPASDGEFIIKPHSVSCSNLNMTKLPAGKYKALVLIKKIGDRLEFVSDESDYLFSITESAKKSLKLKK